MNQRNFTIPATASQVDYTPFLCDISSANSAEQCEDAWQVINFNGTTIVSTHGPTRGSIIPQMFLQFRASTFYLFTSPFSNATANITVSNNDIVVAATFNSSIGMASILGLTEADLSTVVVSFVPEKVPTRLDIDSITLTVTGDPATSIFLPSMTLPPTASLPIFSPALSSPPSPVEASDHHTLVAEAVGITIGLSLGLTVVAVLGYLYWRHRRRRRPPEDCDSEATSRPSHVMPTSQLQTTSTVVRASRAFGIHAHKKDQREKSWFP